MTRLEVLSRLPSEVRNLIRNFESNLEDNAVTRVECPSFPYMDKLAELDALSQECIRGLLSLHFKKDDIEVAFEGLTKNSLLIQSDC